MVQKFVSYIRVSPKEKGDSRLGIEAQRRLNKACIESVKSKMQQVNIGHLNLLKTKMSYKHFTLIEREKLFALKSQKLSNRQIAYELGKHKSSIGRELSRHIPNSIFPSFTPIFS